MAEYIEEHSESDTRTSYPVRKVLWRGATRFQDVIIAESDTYGRMLFLDGEIQSTEADENIYHETLVHPAIASIVHGGSYKGSHKGSRIGDLRILVVGGGEGATVREVLKWGVKQVDWVDIDGELVALCDKLLGWAPSVNDDPRLLYIAGDIREELPRLGTYDVIILDLPDPDGDTGYLYSPEFWKDMNSHLNDDGRMVTHVGPVRPFNGVGEGFQRVREEAYRGGIVIAPSGFYSVCIPSFQSDWGFLMWAKQSGDPFGFARTERCISLPDGLGVVDDRLLRHWAHPPGYWLTALKNS
jgi:spermidine synthase